MTALGEALCTVIVWVTVPPGSTTCVVLTASAMVTAIGVTVQEKVAGVGSLRPAPSTAVTSNWCDPYDSAA